MENIMNALPKMPTAREMAQWDKNAMDFGLPEIMLMENAARAAWQAIREIYGGFAGKSVCLFMGRGNNGGDAAALARIILDDGGQALLLSLPKKDEIGGSPAWHLDLALKNGAKLAHLGLDDLPGLNDLANICLTNFGRLPDLLVDGILGTGFHGELRPAYIVLINRLNEFAAFFGKPFLGLDIPSGLNPLSGQPSPVAIGCQYTITFAAAKPGLMFPRAKEYTGQVICREIGFPQSIKPACPAAWHLLDGSIFRKLSYPLLQNSHKNVWGHVSVIGGAQGHGGAAHIAALAALRAGAGLVTTLAPRGCLEQIKTGSAEIMTCAVGEGKDWPEELTEDVIRRLDNSDAIVLGPGMGVTGSAAHFADCVLQRPKRPPAILDADVLRLFGSGAANINNITDRDVITPHPGEAGALLGCSSREIQDDRLKALNELCQKLPCAVILKGAGALTGQRENLRGLCPYDIPQLAVGGAGDALSGCLGALFASRAWQNENAFAKASLGVILHALAGLAIAAKYPQRGALASDLANALPHIHAILDEQPAVRGSLPWPNFSLLH